MYKGEEPFISTLYYFTMHIPPNEMYIKVYNVQIITITIMEKNLEKDMENTKCGKGHGKELGKGLGKGNGKGYGKD